jgi:hypothetical protein
VSLRQILHFDIADRQQELRDSVAPDDFVLMRRETPLPFPENALAYCGDLQAERVLYSLHGAGLPHLFETPFLYGAQLTGATGIVTVPFERLSEIEPPSCSPRPTLIFSPGRTGSTLLARLVRASGASCASEPDMLTQICRFVREDRRRIGADMEVALLRACLVSLSRALGPAPFVKLRSQCNARPLPLLDAVPGARALFMLRGRHAWARSRHRAFAEPPAAVAAVLREAIDALDKLIGAGVTLQVIWFEALCRDPLRVLARDVGVVAADAGCVARVMSQDAQAGTQIARDRIAELMVDDGFAVAFDLAWTEARQGASWGDATLAYLAAMDTAIA